MIDLDAMQAFVRDYLLRHEPPVVPGPNSWRKSAVARWEHTKRVLAMAQEIARGENADLDVITVATIFHDVAKLNTAQEDHAVCGANIARDYLIRAGLSTDWVERVCQIIVHHPAAHITPPPEMSLEVAVLRDADRLDETGALGIVWSAMNVGIIAPSYAQARERFSHVNVENAQEVVAHMLTPTGRRIAEQRWVFVVKFIAQLNQEMEVNH